MVKEKFEVKASHEYGDYNVDVYHEDGCVHIDQQGESMLIIEEQEWLDLCNNSLDMWGYLCEGEEDDE